MRDITTIVWLWVYSGMSIARAAKAAGIAKGTVVAWFGACRNVCTIAESVLPKMKGTQDEPLQIDESYFRGRRKYSRGRLEAGDTTHPNERAAQQEMEIEMSGWGSDDPSSSDDELEPLRTWRTNYGSRVLGPWVVGIYRNKNDVRFFIVQDRKGDTLPELIRKNCEKQSIVRTDERGGYRRLPEDGFVHETVNHSKWFVDPVSGVHTHGIERMWVEAKLLLKKYRCPNRFLQSHLDGVAWRKRNEAEEETLLACFWRDLVRVHDLSNCNT